MSTTAADRVVTRAEVEQAMRDGRYGAYISYASQLADHLSRRGISAAEVQTFARQRGLRVSDGEAADFVSRLAPTTGTTMESAGSSTIRDTVIGALPAEARGYTRYAEPVIAALEERERNMAEGIIEAAVEEGISRDDVLATIRNVGLTAPTFRMGEESEAGDDGELGVLSREVSRLSGIVDRLKQAAEARGIRI